jgi:uncharacterized repeat protein (TIGR03803 family)
MKTHSACVIILLASSMFAAAQHEKVVYAFGTNSGDGYDPGGGLIGDDAGNLYGMTRQGGAISAGTVYELSQSGDSWTETVLYAFDGGEDGAFPSGNLVFDAAGNLYGTTGGGGNSACSCGTVFELSPPASPGGSWTESTIYTFKGGNDGAFPSAGLVFDPAGNMYGTTTAGGSTETCTRNRGCGTVFELSSSPSHTDSWTETVLYRFTRDDGEEPQGPLVLDYVGNLYGTTFEGGNQHNCAGGCGIVFEVSPSSGGVWTETVLHSFSGINGDGANPIAGLLRDNSGVLAGTTIVGGYYGFGTVFGLLPPSAPGGKWTYEVLYSFGASQNDGHQPLGSLISVGGALYGTTEVGGSQGLGTVFELSRSKGGAWNETGLFSFTNVSNSDLPEAGLLLRSGALFGTTIEGGSPNCSFGCGTVFEIGP